MPSPPPTKKPVSLPTLLGWIAGIVVVLAGAALAVTTVFSSRPAPSPAETPEANGTMPETWAPAAMPARKAPETPVATPTPTAGKHGNVQ